MKASSTDQIRTLRRELMNTNAKQLVLQYDKIRQSSVDRGLAGTAGENLLKKWINEWLPKRMATKSAAVVSHSEGPTNQMDCLVFDQYETPVFNIEGEIEILPIEGVSGCIEMNYGIHTTYDKIITDCEKLSRLADMAMPEKLLPRKGILTGITPMYSPELHTLAMEAKIASLYNLTNLSPKPFLFIWAEDLQGNLNETATRIMKHNKAVGPYNSIDGLFVLKKGVALHRDDQGWHTQRLVGDRLSTLELNQGEVLSKLQSYILHHLWISGKTNPQGFEAYINPEGYLQKTMADASDISDDDYLTQSDNNNAIRVG